MSNYSSSLATYLSLSPFVASLQTSAAGAISFHAYKIADKAEFEKVLARAIVRIEADMNSAQSPQIADLRAR